MTPFDKMLERFTILYGAPATDDIELFFDEYRKALGGVSGDRLARAIDRIVNDHKYRNWPTIGECRAAVRAVTEDMERMSELRNYKPEPERMGEPSAAAKARVDRLQAECVAYLRAVGEAGKGDPPPLPAVDRSAWERRQTALVNAGKWCLSRLRAPIARAA